jgi:hypothetical protein
MVRCDSTPDRVAQRLDGVNGSASGRVLEDYAETRESSVEFDEMGQEGGFGIDHASVLYDGLRGSTSCARERSMRVPSMSLRGLRRVG